MDTNQTRSKRNIVVWLAMLAGGFVVGVGILLGCGVAGYLAGRGNSGGAGAASPAQVSGPSIGTIAPDFELASLTGETMRLSDYRGTPVLLNFWASFCDPCVSEMGLIQEQQEALSSELVILAVDIGDSEDTARSFAEDRGLTFAIMIDADGAVRSQYRANAIPVSYFIDADGVIRAVHVGSLSERQMKRYLLLVGVDE